MLFDTTAPAAVAQEAAERVGVGFVFDYETNTYLMNGGTPQEVAGTPAVQAWLRYVVRVQPGRYAIHPEDFGADIKSLIGQKMPKGMDLSEFNRELQSTARYLPVIRQVSQAAYQDGAIQCEVTLYDKNETEEVITIESAAE